MNMMLIQVLKICNKKNTDNSDHKQDIEYEQL